MTENRDELVETYLERLNRELRDLPEAGRREVVDEVRHHIAEARAEPGSESEAEVRNILERLGDPAEIATEARGRFGVRRQGAEWREVSAIVLLLLGGFVWFVGWIVGLILLWASDRWTVRDKVIGTLVVPGGLSSVVFVLIFAMPGSIVWAAVIVFFLMAPFFTTVYLALRLRRSRLDTPAAATAMATKRSLVTIVTVVIALMALFSVTSLVLANVGPNNDDHKKGTPVRISTTGG
jgi:uncharacterized membrane protein